MKLIISCCLTMIVIAGCSNIPGLQIPTPTPTCAMQALQFLDQITAIADEWTDAETLADSTPRMSLPPAIANLQEIRRRADAIAPPECAALAQTYLIDYMDKTIEGYLLFLSNVSDTEISNQFQSAGNAFRNFQIEMEDIKNR